MFDVEPSKKQRLEWKLDLPIEDAPWNVGLIVGPSGSGKSSVMRHLFGDSPELDWNAPSVVDAVNANVSVEQISGAFSSVGFNTVPAWLRPFHVLSNGEKFRVDLARRLLELPDPIVVDEFTSVVDRQVAQIGSHAIQKFVRKNGRKFVAVGCHYDVIDWLQPDWVLDMATQSFTRRLLQRRPSIECVVARVSISAWNLFAPFHYLSRNLNHVAKCFGLWANGTLAAFAAVIPTPHPTGAKWRVSRLVTLPDWQGIGLASVLLDKLGCVYLSGSKNRVLGIATSLPALNRRLSENQLWKMKKRPKIIGGGRTHIVGSAAGTGRPAGLFVFSGPLMSREEADMLLAGA